ncbi:hypothetical protein [Solitalea canadensis]|uniref:Integral membrane protein n=1 Tax=Solitalea canadensis (strain ATCC 29591 / DSM 3403 / JCM 21819 / LMG 8368 / NBRC 15130 / NCIMB 12057 / USAM 9D) TaxID=929556 RepID=H8KLZ5_SOLCM|nr:hypothetical protein [Solitalea canadensis]AFD08917.1 hypothetical protein Solca_3922 [Solitalea canadensis DSM 3403]
MTHQDIRSYFEAEKSATLVFMIIGILTIIAGIAFFFLKSKTYIGVGFPLVVFGVIQLMVGYSVYSRTDKQVSDVIYSYDMNPDYFKNKELPRMERVNKNFVVYRNVELALFIASIVLIWLNYGKQNVWLGVGAGLFFQALILFASDQFAGRRANKYTNLIKEFIQKN